MWVERRGVLPLAVTLVLTAACAKEDPTPQDESSDADTQAGSTGATTTTGDGTATGTEGETGSTGPEGPITVAQCFADAFVGIAPLPNYDQFGVAVGSHCSGTNHQEISNVERVVFLGDSVTVGTPPTTSLYFYRNRMADALIERFALDPGPAYQDWRSVSASGGTSRVMNSGAFWSCAEWGAKNDDFLMGGNQIEQCFPEETRNQRTLVIMTMGGNDIKDFSQDLAGGTPLADVWTAAEEMVANKRAAIEWLTDPGRFPNGNMVVFANVYEFTDMTGDFLSCQLAASAGFELTLEDPTDMLLIVGWIEEQYAKIAADTGTDFIFMFEHFCGHGFESTNPESPCYRGPDNETWFDLTCIHPNQTGHGQISRMFLDVIDE